MWMDLRSSVWAESSSFTKQNKTIATLIAALTDPFTHIMKLESLKLVTLNIFGPTVIWYSCAFFHGPSMLSLHAHSNYDSFEELRYILSEIVHCVVIRMQTKITGTASKYFVFFPFVIHRAQTRWDGSSEGHSWSGENVYKLGSS